MNTWRQTLSQFRDLVNGLAPRQRMTLAAVPLVVLAVLGLVMSNGATQPEEALFAGKTFTAEELQAARAAFRQAGLTDAHIEGTRILVPQSRIARYQAVLSASSSESSPPADSLEKAVSASTLFMGSGQRQEMIDLARNREVVEMIRKLPQIEAAQIVGHRSRRAGFSGETKMTATLSVTPRSGTTLTSELYRSLQRIVGGALSMADSDVTILNTQTGETIRYPEQDRWPASEAAGIKSDSRTASLPPRAADPGSSLGSGAGASSSAADVRRSGSSSHAAPLVRGSSPDRPSGRKLSARINAWNRIRSDIPELAVPVGGAMLSAFLLWGMRRRKKQRPSPAQVVIDADLAAHSATLEKEKPPTGPVAGPLADRPSENAPAEQITAAINDPKLPAREATQLLTHLPAPRGGDPALPDSAAVPFEFLHHTPAEYVLSFVTEEHPQTIALILAHLPAPLASRVLRGLPTTKQLDVVRRVATLGPARAEVIEEIARSLKGRIATVSPESSGAGRTILRAGPELRLSPLPRNDLRAPNPPSRGAFRDRPPAEEGDFAESLRRMMFVFDDLLKLTDSTLAAVYSRIDASTWAVALKGASEELRSKIIDHIPPAAADRLYLELQDLGPVRVRDIAAAQQQIVEMVRWLEDAGEIIGVDDEADALRIIA
jgi:hypothetical protein